MLKHHDEVSAAWFVQSRVFWGDGVLSGDSGGFVRQSTLVTSATWEGEVSDLGAQV